MNIQDLLQQTNATDAISRELGIDPATAQAGAAALLPSILSGFQQPAAEPSTQSAIGGLGAGGLDSLLGTISALGGGGLLDNVVASQPTEVDKGNQILGQIFGSKDGSRAVAAQAAAQSGVEPSLLKKMLPILAMAVAGYVMKQGSQGQGGGLGDVLGQVLGGQQPQSQPVPQEANAGPGDILGGLIGAAGKFLGR